ncbi:hypothetical protein ACLMJK_002896 [Lecanora helva]
MDLSSPTSLTSPPSRIQDVLRSENISPQGRVPHQQSVSSASQVPNSPTRRSLSSQLASPRYIKQFQALIEHQREVHHEERTLWHTEREELHTKIAELEAALRQLRTTSSSQLVSSIDKQGADSKSNLWNLQSTSSSRQASASGSKEKEVWHPAPDMQPTRTFSETSNQIKMPETRLPSIAEHTTFHTESHGSPSDSHGVTPITTVHGSDIDKNLDGINFKSTGLSQSTKDIMTPQSPSPLSPLSSRVSLGTIKLPEAGLAAPEDPYTKDAGHTPSARRSSKDDRAPSAPSSGAATPTQPEIERPPLAPRSTGAKVPSERSDSYFPPPEDPSGDPDPALSGPLGLTNDEVGDKQFLTELDSKLLRAASSEAQGSPAVAGADDLAEAPKSEERGIEQPEQEPKLRIKRSMNFGSALGSGSIGRGFRAPWTG